MLKYFKNAKAVSIFLIVAGLSSCNQSAPKSPVLKEVFTENNITEIAKKVEHDDVITLRELTLLNQGIARLSGVKDSIVGKTVGDVITSQESLSRQVTINGLKNTAIKTEVNLTHDFKFEKLDFSDNPEEKSYANVLTFTIKNTSTQAITNLQGYINAVDPQNRVVKRFPINIKKPIEPGTNQQIISPGYKHDINNQNDVFMRNNLQKLRAIWQPLLVTLADGKTIDLTKSAEQQENANADEAKKVAN